MSKSTAVMPKVLKFGWIPDVPDRRDFLFKSAVRPLSALQPAVNLAPLAGPVLNQGSIGSCSAFAALSVFYAASVPAKLRRAQIIANPLLGFPSTVSVHTLVPTVARQLDQSELFQYYESRKLHNTVNEDSGASIRNAIKSLGKTGVCSETAHPYADTVHAMVRPPTPASYQEASKFKALKYQRVDNRVAGALYSALSLGNVIVFGSMLYESFMETKTVARMPLKRETALGGHAMVLVGYDLKAKRFLVKNSWGTEWAMRGYHWMPEAYLTDINLSDDFWTISSVSVA